MDNENFRQRCIFHCHFELSQCVNITKKSQDLHFECHGNSIKKGHNINKQSDSRFSLLTTEIEVRFKPGLPVRSFSPYSKTSRLNSDL